MAQAAATFASETIKNYELMIAYILLTVPVFAILLAVIFQAVKEGWTEYRMSARVRIARIRFCRAVEWASLFGLYVKGSCSAQPSLRTSKAS